MPRYGSTALVRLKPHSARGAHTPVLAYGARRDLRAFSQRAQCSTCTPRHRTARAVCMICYEMLTHFKNRVQVSVAENTFTHHFRHSPLDSPLDGGCIRTHTLRFACLCQVIVINFTASKTCSTYSKERMNPCLIRPILLSTGR